MFVGEAHLGGFGGVERVERGGGQGYGCLFAACVLGSVALVVISSSSPPPPFRGTRWHAGRSRGDVPRYTRITGMEQISSIGTKTLIAWPETLLASGRQILHLEQNTSISSCNNVFHLSEEARCLRGWDLRTRTDPFIACVSQLSYVQVAVARLGASLLVILLERTQHWYCVVATYPSRWQVSMAS